MTDKASEKLADACPVCGCVNFKEHRTWGLWAHTLVRTFKCDMQIMRRGDEITRLEFCNIEGTKQNGSATISKEAGEKLLGRYSGYSQRVDAIGVRPSDTDQAGALR